jgi:DNA-binding transcriptional LysR family regulator
VVKASREVTGSLRIGAEQCLGIVDVAELLERFHRRHPRVETHFTQAGSQQLVALARGGELDVAFVATTKHLGPLQARTLGKEPLVLLAPSDHPLAAGGAARQEVSWAELEGEDFIDFTDSWGIRELNDETLAAHDVNRRVRCTVNDVHTLLDLVTRGLGIAIVPRHVAAKPQASSLKALALPGSADRPWIVSVVSPVGSRTEAPAAPLLELLAQTPALPRASVKLTA